MESHWEVVLLNNLHWRGYFKIKVFVKKTKNLKYCFDEIILDMKNPV